MRNNAIALQTMLGGFLAVFAGITVFVLTGTLNYRDAGITEWFGVYVALAFSLFLLGVYITALRIRQTSRRELEIEPSFLVLGCLPGWVIGGVDGYIYRFHPALSRLADWQDWLFLPSLSLHIVLLLSLTGLWIACQFELTRSGSHSIWFLLRSLVPMTISLIIIAIVNNGFPGNFASAEVRQQWAGKEFRYYEQQIVKPIKTCKPIIERVGNVKFVAPTTGKNYIWSDQGSSGHYGELTLEVVGENGVGVGNSTFHIGTSVGYVQFVYQGKSERLKCF